MEIQDFEKGGGMISLRWISGFWIVGERRPLRAEFALSSVAIVTRDMKHCTDYILRQEIGLGFVTT